MAVSSKIFEVTSIQNVHVKMVLKYSALFAWQSVGKMVNGLVVDGMNIVDLLPQIKPSSEEISDFRNRYFYLINFYLSL